MDRSAHRVDSKQGSNTWAIVRLNLGVVAPSLPKTPAVAAAVADDERTK